MPKDTPLVKFVSLLTNSKIRKYCIWRILAPYLINKRRFDENKSHTIIEEWLNKCNQLEPLDFEANHKIIDGIKGAIKTGCYPIAFKIFERRTTRIWNLITCKTVMSL